jgi:hypothetical protein
MLSRLQSVTVGSHKVQFVAQAGALHGGVTHVGGNGCQKIVAAFFFVPGDDLVLLVICPANVKIFHDPGAQIDQAARLFATLSEPSRLRLLQALMPGPMTVTELVEAIRHEAG